MMLLLTSIAALIPDTVPQEYDAYSRCISVHRDRRRGEIASPLVLREQALPHCRAERAALVTRLATNLAEDMDAERRQRADNMVSVLERYLPGKFKQAVRIVPRDECATELKVGNRCLE